MEITDMSNTLPILRKLKAWWQATLIAMCSLWRSRCWASVPLSNINPILSPTIYNCEIAPELGFAILVAFEEK